MAEYALKVADAKGPEAKLIEQAKIIGGEYTDADLKIEIKNFLWEFLLQQIQEM